MLSKFFISKVRIKMLEHFLGHTEEEFHVRGVVRILDEEINAVRRELNNLEEAGLLVSKRKGNRLYYRVDPSYIMIPDLQTLFLKEREDIQAIHKTLLKHEGIETAFVTDNYLAQEYDSPNDIDIMILGTVDVASLTTDLKELEKKINRELRVTALTAQDLEFQHKKRDDFLLNILRSKKLFIIGNDSNLI